MNANAPAWVVGRYAIYDEIASGGMATVYYGRLLGPVGFSRPVAIKRLHPHLAKEADFVGMLLDEARLAAHIQHPNVVQTLDVVTTDREGVYIVMQYVQGETLGYLVRKIRRSEGKVPLKIAAAIAVGVLDGLHAAHEATDERGVPLGIVHRDVSPQNVIIGLDGVPRLLDFGVAKAAGRTQTTREGQLKGKLSYMAPEQVRAEGIDRRTDVYAASVVFWEMLVGKKLVTGDSEARIIERVINMKVEPPSKEGADVPSAIDKLVLRGLSRDPDKRFATAREMARQIEKVVTPASATEVGEWVQGLVGDELSQRAKRLAEGDAGSNPSSASKSRPATPGQPITPGAVGEIDVDLADADDMPPARTAKETTSASFSVADAELFASVRPPRRRFYLAMAAALLGALGAILIFSRATPAPASSPPPPVDSVASPPPLPPETAPAPPPPPAAEAQPSAADSPVIPSAVPHTAASPPVVAPRRGPRAPSGGARPTGGRGSQDGTSGAADKPSSRSGCNPPFTVDSDGVKNYKPECL